MSAPTAAAMRATVALFGEPTPGLPKAWLKKRAAVVDREIRLPQLLAAADAVLAMSPEIPGFEHLTCVKALRDEIAKARQP